jgi:hypothetical protein
MAAEKDDRLQELVGEGIQVLEQARLVRLRGVSYGQSFRVAYIATRFGRAALEQDAVARILGVDG